MFCMNEVPHPLPERNHEPAIGRADNCFALGERDTGEAIVPYSYSCWDGAHPPFPRYVANVLLQVLFAL